MGHGLGIDEAQERMEAENNFVKTILVSVGNA
jgi:hypothetical protein